MSNSVGHNLLHQSLLPPTVLEHQSKTKFSCKAQATSRRRKSPLSAKFRGQCLGVQKTKLQMENHRVVSASPQAVLATYPASELAEKFNLDGNIGLQVDVSSPTQGSISLVDIHVRSNGDTLLLHWGGIHNKKEKWVLPTHRPNGTKVYKNRALRTPFVKSGYDSLVKIEIDDPAIQAIEFLIFDEAHNKWFKNNGQNFHVKLPVKEKLIPNVSVPEDLVQIQAYLRWERKGKQIYTPKQEKASI